MSERQLIVTIEDPPPQSERPPIVVNWDEIVDLVKHQHPNQWVRVQHTYSTPGSARSSVQRAARLHGLDYRVTTRSPQEDGRPGVFIKYVPREE